MDLTYRFTYKDGHLFVESNAVFEGLDFLNLLASDIKDPESYEAFKQCISSKNTWWDDATKVEFTDSKCKVSPSFEWPGELNVSIQSLNEFLFELRKHMSRGGRDSI